MGLKIWLPLNGDLTNQGLSNATVTNYGATVNANGKIGKCYSFDGSDDYIQLSSFDMSGLEEYTISCWVKPNDSGISYLFLVRGGGTHQIRISGDGLMFRDTKNSAQRIVAFGEAFVPDKWVHICCVYNRGEIFMYQNGMQTSHSTSYYHADGQTNSGLTEIRIGRSQSSSGNSYFSGCVNDFRIYDNALSAREIYELSRGLIVWFPLSPIPVYKITGDNIYTTANIAKANSSSSYSVSAISDTSFRLYTNKNVAYASTKQTVASLGLTVGKRYRMKCKIDITRLDTRIIVGLRDSNNTYRASTGNLYEGGIYEYEFVLTSDMSYLSFLGTYESSQCDITFSDIEIYELQEENIVYDISGYQRNGIKSNISYDSDTVRNTGCSVFNGSNSYVKVSTNDWMIQGTEAMTVNFWAYSTDWTAETDGGRMISCTQTGGFNLEGGSSGYIRFPHHVYTNAEHSATAYQYKNTGIKLSSLSSGWHMFTLVYSLSGEKIYIDGELHSSTTTVSYGLHYNTNARLYLGCEANTANPTTPYFNGKMSDFRLYYTELSAEDVAELYGFIDEEV